MAVETLPMPSPHDPDAPVFAVHRGGKIEVISKLPLRDRDDLSLAYTPGVAEVCRQGRGRRDRATAASR